MKKYIIHILDGLSWVLIVPGLILMLPSFLLTTLASLLDDKN